MDKIPTEKYNCFLYPCGSLIETRSVARSDSRQVVSKSNKFIKMVRAKGRGGKSNVNSSWSGMGFLRGNLEAGWTTKGAGSRHGGQENGSRAQAVRRGQPRRS